MLTSPLPLELIVIAKILAQILSLCAALTLMSFPAALLLDMDASLLPTLILTFILGIPLLALLGGIAGALTVMLQRNAALMTLLLIPFYIPVLIFAVSACDRASGTQPLLLLGALLALILPSAPFIIAAALRQGQS